MFYHIKKNSALLFRATLKSIGAATVILLTINSGAFLSEIVSSWFYKENTLLFQQSAFSLEGLYLSDNLDARAVIGFFLFTFIAVMAHELKENQLSEYSTLPANESADHAPFSISSKPLLENRVAEKAA